MFCYKYLSQMNLMKSLSCRNLFKSLPLLGFQINGFCSINAEELKIIPQTKTTSKIQTTLNKTSRYIIPPLSTSYLGQIDTMTAIIIGYSHLSWIKFSINSLTVLDWNAKVLPQNFGTNLYEPSLISLAYNIGKSLPPSDLFVAETFSMARMKEWQRKVNEIHLFSMLIVHMHGVDADPGQKTKLVFQEKRVLDKVFNITVDSERVISRNITISILEEVNKIKKNSVKITLDNFNSAIQINSKLINFFKNSGILKQEDLSLVFLLALSVIQVNFLKIKEIKLPKIKRKKQ